MATKVQVVIDCADPSRLADFWSEALGYRTQDPPPGFATWPDFLRSIDVPESEWNSANAVVDPDGVGPRIFLQRVPELKANKNRVHLDLNVGGGPQVPVDERKVRVEAEAERLVRLGATVVEPRGQHGEFWMVMQDPEGNEFCVQ